MASSVADLMVPGFGTAANAVAVIKTLCEDMNNAEDTCLRLYHRLLGVLNGLKAMEAAAQQLPPSEMLAPYPQLLLRFIQCMQNYQKMGIVTRVIRYEKTLETIQVLNGKVDTLMKQWKQQWEADRNAQRYTMGANAASVESDELDERAQMEAMAQLNSQMKQYQARLSQKIPKPSATSGSPSEARVPAMPSWFVPAEVIEYDQECFAFGSFGRVHRGTYADTNVVVKVLMVDEFAMSDAAMARFVDEMSIWHKLSHPHIIKVFGASHTTLPPFIVCEDATNGNMANFLIASVSNKKQMWKLLYEAAQGLEYLHRNQIVHGELKLNNILVGSDGQARLTDFGMSAVRAASQSTDSPRSVTARGLRWRAPESFTKEPTFASDVYSFAMCIIEAATDEPPFAFLGDSEFYEFVTKGSPEQPEELIDDAWALVESMTRFDPAARAPLQSVLSKLNELAGNEAPTAAATPANSLTATSPVRLNQTSMPGKSNSSEGLIRDRPGGEEQSDFHDGLSKLNDLTEEEAPTAVAAPANSLTATNPGESNSSEDLICDRPGGEEQRDFGATHAAFDDQDDAQQSSHVSPHEVP